MHAGLKRHAYTFWLLAAVVLAMLVPGPASQGGFLHPELTTKLGVWLIFFLQGLSLPTRELAAGYKPKRLHAFVLFWNYLFFPLVTILVLWPLSLILEPELCLGFAYLAILPTTVASAITFSSVSGGSIGNAIFSTVFSNLLSVLLVPTIAVAYLAAGAEVQVPLSPLFAKLALLILLPLVLGQILRAAISGHAVWLAKRTRHLSHGIIVFIVHAAFADSVSSGFLDQLSLGGIAIVICGVVFLLLLVSALVWSSSSWLGLDRVQRISAFFCSSQKSLAMGLPLATSILSAVPGVADSATVLIPLMCYHPLQLFLAGLVSGRLLRFSVR